MTLPLFVPTQRWTPETATAANSSPGTWKNRAYRRVIKSCFAINKELIVSKDAPKAHVASRMRTKMRVTYREGQERKKGKERQDKRRNEEGGGGKGNTCLPVEMSHTRTVASHDDDAKKGFPSTKNHVKARVEKGQHKESR